MKYTDYIIPIGEDAQDYDEMFIGVIRRQPELVRCKECRHRPTEIEEDDETYIEFPEDSRCPCHCEDHYYNWMPADDWFCGNGERSEE